MDYEHAREFIVSFLSFKKSDIDDYYFDYMYSYETIKTIIRKCGEMNIIKRILDNSYIFYVDYAFNAIITSSTSKDAVEIINYFLDKKLEGKYDLSDDNYDNIHFHLLIPVVRKHKDEIMAKIEAIRWQIKNKSTIYNLKKQGYDE